MCPGSLQLIRLRMIEFAGHAYGAVAQRHHAASTCTVFLCSFFVGERSASSAVKTHAYMHEVSEVSSSLTKNGGWCDVKIRRREADNKSGYSPKYHPRISLPIISDYSMFIIIIIIIAQLRSSLRHRRSPVKRH